MQQKLHHAADMHNRKGLRYTVLYIQDAFDSQEYKHEIGDTGILTLYNTDIAISKLHICGIHLFPFSGENLNKMRLDQYYNT